MTVTVALLVVLAVTALGVVLPVSVLLWRFRRRNRLHPRVPTAAPTAWLASPARAARLHRRLRTATLVASVSMPAGRRRAANGSPVDDLAAELLQEAAALDQQLAMAARAP